MSYSSYPEFSWDGYFWGTSANLPSWVGFQSRNGPYGAISSAEKSSGIIKIVFAPEGRDGSELNDSEKALVNWVVENEKEIHDSLIKLLFKLYPSIKVALSESDEDTLVSLSEINAPIDIKSIVGVVSINVHQIEKGGIPYVGVELGCDWDEEHGAGVLFYGAEPLEVGGADTAVLLWLAKKYANQSFPDSPGK